MHTIYEGFTHVPKSRNMERLTTLCPMGMSEDTRVVARNNGRSGVGGGRGRGGNGKDYLPKSRRTYDDSTCASGEVNAKSADWKEPKCWRRGKKRTLQIRLGRESLKDAEEPGTGLTFDHPSKQMGRQEAVIAVENAGPEQNEAVTTVSSHGRSDNRQVREGGRGTEAFVAGWELGWTCDSEASAHMTLSSTYTTNLSEVREIN